jgi:hypothetical protein
VIHPQCLQATDSEERLVLEEGNVLFITLPPRSFLKRKKQLNSNSVCVVCAWMGSKLQDGESEEDAVDRLTLLPGNNRRSF